MAGITPGAPSAPSFIRTINAEHLLLALVARKAVPSRRWAAMSERIDTQACDRRRASWHFAMPPMLSPMHRGRFDAVLSRTRCLHGLAEVRKTWRTGLRALVAETSGVVL